MTTLPRIGQRDGLAVKRMDGEGPGARRWRGGRCWICRVPYPRKPKRGYQAKGDNPAALSLRSSVSPFRGWLRSCRPAGMIARHDVRVLIL